MSMSYPEKVQRMYAEITNRYAGEAIPASALDIDIPVPRNGDRWGDWVLNTSEPASLDYIGGFYQASPYWIRLDRIFSLDDTYRSNPGFTGWIKHLHDKEWGRKSMGDFVDAVLTIGRYGYMKGKKHVTVWPKSANEF